MKLCYIGLVYLFVILGAASLFVQPVYACSPTASPPMPTADTLENRISQTPIVFEGTVTAITENRYETTIQVTRYIKGNGPMKVTVSGFGWGSDCLPVAKIGQYGTFYVVENSGRFSIQPWSGVEPISNSTINMILIAFVGGIGLLIVVVIWMMNIVSKGKKR